MKNNRTIKLYHKLSFIFAFGLSISSINNSFASEINANRYVLPFDSVGTEIINGNRFVIHKLQNKETYYQLSRIYSVPVKDIMEANANKNLRLGENIKIPRGKALAVTNQNKSVTTVENTNQPEFIEYKVGKSETLYSISRRFQVTVEDIKKANGLNSNSLREDMILKIPTKTSSIAPQVPPQRVQVEPELPIAIEENKPIDDSIFKPNKYGIREKKERGVGIWQESLSGDGQSSLALHKTAPIGTILKITNPMNQSVTFAKVVGKFGDNEDTQGAIVVISKSVATSIGVLDKKFQVEITYGVPLD